MATVNPQPPMPAPAAMPVSATSQQVASIPASNGSAGRLLFDGGSATLSDSARQALDGLASQLAGNEQRLKVVAFAAGQTNNASQARRLSLSRALAVRAYLIDKGIRSTRIDVQAMGAPENANGPADRVDLSLSSQ
jgi:outer membrane protein OmpA-like peptidoglycan-associated protein